VAPKQPGSESGILCYLRALQEMVYHRKTFTSVQELKLAIVTAWQQLSQAFLDRSIGEWRRRLENMVLCNGGHIEHVC